MNLLFEASCCCTAADFAFLFGMLAEKRPTELDAQTHTHKKKKKINFEKIDFIISIIYKDVRKEDDDGGDTNKTKIFFLIFK